MGGEIGHLQLTEFMEIVRISANDIPALPPRSFTVVSLKAKERIPRRTRDGRMS